MTKEQSNLFTMAFGVFHNLRPTVVVNFICHLDWATGCLDIWLNIILGATVMVFLDEMMHIAFLNVGGSHLTC